MKVLKWLFDFYVSLIIFAANSLPAYKDALIGNFLKKMGSVSYYYTLHWVPRRIDGLNSRIVEHYDYSKVAIVVQGPVITDDDFTLNSLRIYKALFPDAKVILSTWSDLDLETELRASKLCTLVKSDYPENPGALNLNYQLVSSKNGAICAIELGAEFAFKVRTDQRICHPEAIFNCINQMKLFRTEDSFSCKGRIVLVGDVVNSSSAIAFHASDFVSFGYAEDILLLYSAPLDTRPYAFESDVLKVFKDQYRLTRANELNLLDFIKDDSSYDRFVEELMAPEQYIFQRYSESISNAGQRVVFDNHLGFYRYFLKHFFIIVDANTFDLYWYKKSFKYVHSSVHSKIASNSLLTNSRWLDIYLNFSPQDVERH